MPTGAAGCAWWRSARRAAGSPCVWSAAMAEPWPPIAGQISSELADGTLVLSCAKPVEDGARAALIVAPGRFRLDVSRVDDTLEISVRNLSGARCAWSAADAEP